MKCLEVSLLLDSSLPGSLGRAQHDAIEAHLSTCVACREDWANWREISALAVPAMPEGLRARIAAVLPAQRRAASRTALRPLLAGGVLLAGAALATTLALRFARQNTEHVAASAAGASTAPTTGIVDESVAPAAGVASTGNDRQTQGASAQPVRTVTQRGALMVVVMPLIDNSDDEAGKAAVQVFHASLLDGLRRLPGLRVMEAVAGAAEVAADYRITLTGQGSASAGKFVADVKVEKPSTGPIPNVSYLQSLMAGDIEPDCARLPARARDSAAGDCADPAGLAHKMIETLRTTVFPPDPLLSQQLKDTLANSALDAGARLQAMEELVWVHRNGRVIVGNADPNPLAGTDVVRSAIDVGMSAKDPAHRAYVWRSMRGVREAALVPALLATLERDPDPSVRVAAAVTLDADYLDRPEVRVAFEGAARTDSRALVRALAQRALAGGDAGWREHIAASLRDTTLADAERIEALFHDMHLATTQPFGSWSPGPSLALQYLDEPAMEALAEVLPRAAAGSPVIRMGTVTLVSALEGRDGPAIRALREFVNNPAPAVMPGVIGARAPP